MTAFQLASCGCPDEDLFGILACLLHLLSTEQVDPLEIADVSAENLFTSRSVNGCRHQSLTAAELVDCVPEAAVETWPAPARVGWQVFRCILWLAQIAGSEILELEDGEAKKYVCKYISTQYDCTPHIFRKRPKLGVLHAAIQTELLTYRRLQEDDPWVSKNFDLSLLLRDLQDIDGQLHIFYRNRHKRVTESFLRLWTVSWPPLPSKC
ncbi:hypothetical protein V8E54_011132 [Elaphomyces granulatus]